MPATTRSSVKREKNELAEVIRRSKLDRKNKILSRTVGSLRSERAPTASTVKLEETNSANGVITEAEVAAEAPSVFGILPQPSESVQAIAATPLFLTQSVTDVPNKSKLLPERKRIHTIGPELSQCLYKSNDKSALEEDREARIIRRNMPRVGSRAYKQPFKSSRYEENQGQKPSLKLTLSDVRYYKISKGRLKQMKVRRPKLSKAFWPYEGHKFKLGHDPWAGFGLPPPREEEIRRIHQLLMDHNRSFEFAAFVALPAHAATQAVTVDNLIQTIFSQTTGNELAIDGHSRLCNAFPYIVHGIKYAGTIPNWHVIRTTSTDEFERMLQPMGLQLARAKAVKALLDVVYNKNLQRRFQRTQQYDHELNDPDAKDFVPGLLSIDYLVEDNPTTEALLGRLLELPKFGPKSAMCVAAFSYRRPLFVVDVHVARFCKWLNWVPAHASEIEAACYLHSLVPDDIKFDLHNQIWSHCAVENSRERHGRGVICYTCGSSPPAKNKKIRSCPLDPFLPPLHQRWKRKYQPIDEGSDTTQVKRTYGGAETSSDTKYIIEGSMDSASDGGLLPKQTSNTKGDGDETLQKSMENAEVKRARTSRTIKKVGIGEHSLVKAKKWPRTVPYESMSQAEAAQVGYLLWEFRPMDNSFGEEWGTFDKHPRFRWEKPDIMDAEVAVTVEYADGVLEGRIGHKWMKRRGAVDLNRPEVSLFNTRVVVESTESVPSLSESSPGTVDSLARMSHDGSTLIDSDDLHSDRDSGKSQQVIVSAVDAPYTVAARYDLDLMSDSTLSDIESITTIEFTDEDEVD